MSSDIKINRGLKGIYFERSGISDIDGANGKLTYRGYQISDLAKNSSFEEVLIPLNKNMSLSGTTKLKISFRGKKNDLVEIDYIKQK